MEFPPAVGVRVAVSADSGLCPPAWPGIVVLGAAGIATVPSARATGAMADAARRLTPDGLVDPARLRELPPVRDVLGPASSVSEAIVPFGLDFLQP